MSWDNDCEMADSVGLSDDPDYVPSSEKDENCEPLYPDSPLVSRRQCVKARQKHRDGQGNVICDATRILIQGNKKEIKYPAIKSRDKTSFVWSFFKKLLTVDGVEVKDRVVCNICGDDFKYQTSTSGMAYHVKSKHRWELKNHKLAAPGQTARQSIKGKSLMTKHTRTQPKLSKKSATWKTYRLLARFVITSYSPISVVENPQLQEFVDAISETKYYLPTSQYIKNNVMLPMAEETENVIKAMLFKVEAFGISITADGWQSGPGDSYENVTVHWVDDSYELKMCFLGAIPIHKRHTAEDICEMIEGKDGILAKWGLMGKPRVYVTDNECNLKKGWIDLSGKEWLECFAHTLHLTVVAGFSVDRISKVISVAKSLVEFIHTSSVARNLLKMYERQLGLKELTVIMHCITRWNSVLHMIERLCMIQNAVVLTLTDCKRQDLMPSIDDWKLMGEMVDVLKLFDTTTELISGEKYPTIVYIKPLIGKITTHLTKVEFNESASITQMKSKMLKDLETRYTDARIKEMLIIGAILDPRNKNYFMTSTNKNILIKKAIHVIQSKNANDNVNTQAEVIHCAEGQQYELLSRFSDLSGLPEPSTSSTTSTLTSTDLMVSLFEDPDSVNPSRESLEEEIEYEVKAYLKYKVNGVKDKLFNVLKWWKDNSVMFPNLSILVKQYLCVPATSTSSERCFTKSRNRLLPENVEMLTFLQNNFKYIPPETTVKDIDNESEGEVSV
ncbi:unnamed protein product [Meganyctiphanes norvegica]|uniref:BED-type domain-containing protein n=2 Tax=Meganyctiphanes norvegica TaxID=48144 RepID=A0AAV2RF84_MEGNR